MEEHLSKGRKISFTAIIIACVIAILKNLYDIGYAPYTMTDAFEYGFHVKETLGYRIYDNDILSVLLKIFFYAGLVSLYTLWEKPRPTAVFILLILAMVLPTIITKGLNLIIDKQMENFNYSFVQSLAYMIYFPIALVVWTSTKWITTAKLYTKADKQAKLILISYMIIFAIGLAGSLLYFSYAWTFNLIFNIAYLYIYRAASIVLYVLTIIYLKRKLGAQMPFTNAYRFAKKECTNRPPEDD